MTSIKSNNMKKILSIAAAVLVLAFSFQEVSAQTTSQAGQAIAQILTASNGNSAGGALLGLFSQYKTDGKIDMTNANNIANIIKLIQNIRGLGDKSNENNTNFLSGLISGSQSLVNQNNAPDVLSTLTAISTLDTEKLTQQAASTATKGLLSKLGFGSKTTTTQSNPTADAATSALVDIFGAFTKQY